MLRVKDLQTKYKGINSVKSIMLMYGLTLSDLKPLVSESADKKNILKKLAGAWKNKKINPVDYQRKLRAELE